MASRAAAAANTRQIHRGPDAWRFNLRGRGAGARSIARFRATLPRVTILAALDAFYQEHRRCGELDGGVKGDRVWMTCSCGAVIDSNVSGEGN